MALGDDSGLELEDKLPFACTERRIGDIFKWRCSIRLLASERNNENFMGSPLTARAGSCYMTPPIKVRARPVDAFDSLVKDRLRRHESLY